MRIEPKQIHLVTYCVERDLYEPCPLSTWIDTDQKLYFEKRKGGETWLILDAYDTPGEAIARAAQLEADHEAGDSD